MVQHGQWCNMSTAKFNTWEDINGTQFLPVLQVVSTTLTSVASTTNGDITGTGGDVGLNVTITPKSSNSKFLIYATIGVGSCVDANTWVGILSRDGNKIGNGDNDGGNRYGVLFRGVDHTGNSGVDLNHGLGASGSYLDNTSGTKGVSITYKLGIVVENASGVGVAYINRVESDYNTMQTAAAARTSSTITVMEISK